MPTSPRRQSVISGVSEWSVPPAAYLTVTSLNKIVTEGRVDVLRHI